MSIKADVVRSYLSVSISFSLLVTNPDALTNSCSPSTPSVKSLQIGYLTASDTLETLKLCFLVRGFFVFAFHSVTHFVSVYSKQGEAVVIHLSIKITLHSNQHYVYIHNNLNTRDTNSTSSILCTTYIHSS